MLRAGRRVFLILPGCPGQLLFLCQASFPWCTLPDPSDQVHAPLCSKASNALIIDMLLLWLSTTGYQGLLAHDGRPFGQAPVRTRPPRWSVAAGRPIVVRTAGLEPARAELKGF